MSLRNRQTQSSVTSSVSSETASTQDGLASTINVHKKIKITVPNPKRGRVGWRELLGLLPVVTVLPYLCGKLHYQLPTPVMDGSPLNLPPRISEYNIRSHTLALEQIGFRTVGTQEAVEGEQYVYQEVMKLQEWCRSEGVLECDAWLQEGDGQHQFDILDHPVLKSYSGIRNVILRIRGPNTTTTITGDEMQNAVLLNAHIDSALPSPGAADDAIGVGVMLDCARVLIERKQPIFGAAIFLFNGAEETLQDASHLYSTAHETRHSVKTVINLEAAGSRGHAVVFQAGTNEMIYAYSHTTRPAATVIASDIFGSGIIGSDTDYGQFVKYLGITGLDTAVVEDSYKYHTRRDTVENIEIGTAQHFGDTTMEVLDYLLREGSPLNTDTPWTPLNIVYFSLYDRFFIYYSMTTANLMAVGVTVAWLSLLVLRAPKGRLGLYAKAVGSVFVSFIGALLGALAVAVIMRYGLQRGLTWFSHEHSSMILYGAPALTGSLTAQYFLFRRTSPQNQSSLEHASAYGMLGFYSTVLLIFQLVGIKSGYLLLNVDIAGVIFLGINEMLCCLGSGIKRGAIYFLVVHVIWSGVNVFLGTEAVTNFLDVFVPLMGRSGVEAPAEIIISILSSLVAFVFSPTVIPLFHRCSPSEKPKVLLGMVIATGLIMAYFANSNVYDAEHPKRIGAQYMYNVTSGETTMHLAQMDSGPGYETLLSKVHARYGTPTAEITASPRGVNPDWDVLYPVSIFIHSEKWVMENALVADVVDLPKVGFSVLNDEWDEAEGSRDITFEVNHQGLVYPVLSFSASISSWSFLSEPPIGNTRHYIKAAASPGHEVFNVTMRVKCEKGDKLGMNWVGIDTNQMYPQTAPRLGKHLPSTAIFRDMDDWLREEWNDSLEVLMIGVVGGVVEI